MSRKRRVLRTTTTTNIYLDQMYTRNASLYNSVQDTLAAEASQQSIGNNRNSNVLEKSVKYRCCNVLRRSSDSFVLAEALNSFSNTLALTQLVTKSDLRPYSRVSNPLCELSTGELKRIRVLCITS